jgi:hypothetical protein
LPGYRIFRVAIDRTGALLRATICGDLIALGRGGRGDFLAGRCNHSAQEGRLRRRGDALLLLSTCAETPEKKSGYHEEPIYRTGSNIPTKDYRSEKIEVTTPDIINPINRRCRA